MKSMTLQNMQNILLFFRRLNLRTIIIFIIYKILYLLFTGNVKKFLLLKKDVTNMMRNGEAF